MEESTLSLEKLNSERITRLEGKVDRVLEFVSKKNGGDWRGVALVIAIIGLVGGVLGQNIVFIDEQVDAHTAIRGHPHMLEEVAALKSKTTDLSSGLGDADREIMRIRLWKDITEAELPTLRERVGNLKEMLFQLDERFQLDTGVHKLSG